VLSPLLTDLDFAIPIQNRSISPVTAGRIQSRMEENASVTTSLCAAVLELLIALLGNNPEADGIRGCTKTSCSVFSAPNL
jgi:hypothetical protein